MLITKVFKYKKLIFCVMIIMGIAFYYLTHSTGSAIDVPHHTQILNNQINIRDVQVVDKEMVIRALKAKAELVSNEGIIDKAYKYSDSIFSGHNYIKDMFGERTLDVFVKGFFKTGIDLSSISSENVVVHGTTLFIKLNPDQMTLISLDVPFNTMEFHASNGLFRSGLSLEDKQVLYGEIRKSIENEII